MLNGQLLSDDVMSGTMGLIKPRFAKIGELKYFCPKACRDCDKDPEVRQYLHCPRGGCALDVRQIHVQSKCLYDIR